MAMTLTMHDHQIGKAPESNDKHFLAEHEFNQSIHICSFSRPYRTPSFPFYWLTSDLVRQHSSPRFDTQDPTTALRDPDMSCNDKMRSRPDALHSLPATTMAPEETLEWNWDVEHSDRRREKQADAALHGALPFLVDRSVLKDVVREKFATNPARIMFLSAGTFHKAYLVTLVDGRQVVARVARRFMPRLKTESEVATMQYLQQNTNVPVPFVYHYDSNPYNRLGGEYILMSKAPGRPLAEVYHSLGYNDLVNLLRNIAKMVIPLFAHRFPQLGSLYFGPSPPSTPALSNAATPKAVQTYYSAFPFSSTLAMSTIASPTTATPNFHAKKEYHVGPIISWPFFGSHRGDLAHPDEINRGPWTTSESYFQSCTDREVNGVIRENEGKSAPHRLHLDPDEIISSRHHQLQALPGDQSDDSDEWDLEESEAEWDGPGDAMYRDYRRMQRSTFLIAHLEQRIERVQAETNRWLKLMEKLANKVKKEGPSPEAEMFGLDCHDLSLENVFVDIEDPTKITCIIDWESTTTRPLWACAHLPAFLQASPFTAKLFREIVVEMASKNRDQNACLANDWLYYEAAGTRLRMAHRFTEWDGWEEGLVDSILGPEESEEDWLNDPAVTPEPESNSAGAAGRRKPSLKLPLPLEKELEKEQMLNKTGDICGGRGGELGRRLEAWLTVTQQSQTGRFLWEHSEDDHHDELPVKMDGLVI
ncbi:uncharacterized protein BT62DRAFT_702658 [Guyanagaster necrorhizus]|uniref:Aminoglycoside phosphotransferase domain-containing protein n=1 Tax=Guyanagaster necrorhizus TaxID=856835 RepID=A0A9P7VY63_9AGAR|nr:uncharacterized protein BT62DRAFT_702658 [Guyanagaster necrorhizus MCA 3950]KAG7448379.1 hypothetical protein BT62DRAFT_702658 [Guyanagaster necrorhizus MCA 3950]